MMNPWTIYPILYPYLPTINEKPPTIYAILNSIVNFGKEDKTKIRQLAKIGRTTIFDFDYPLTEHISKEDFECMILNHYMMRRIGFETVTAFQLQLEVKLNEIMPMYNKLFDAISDWHIFTDGEVITHTSTDNRITNNINKLNNTSTTNTVSTSDRRNSELPQNEIENVKDGNYITDYSYDTNINNGNDTSNATGESNTTDNNILNETTTRTPADKMKNYQEFLESKQNIYTMIFKDLDSLFYQIV